MRHFAAGESLFTAAQAELKAATIEPVHDPHAPKSQLGPHRITRSRTPAARRYMAYINALVIPTRNRKRTVGGCSTHDEVRVRPARELSARASVDGRVCEASFRG